jgi:hypothetical protein
LRSWVTGLESSNWARRRSSAARRTPKRAASSVSGAAARAPRAVIPHALSRSTVLGPMPGTSPQPAPAKRAQACSRLSTTKPRGFSASEATLATSLFGPIPIEHVSPVAASSSSRRARIAPTGAGISVRSRYASSSPTTSTVSTRSRTIRITASEAWR